MTSNSGLATDTDTIECILNSQAEAELIQAPGSTGSIMLMIDKLANPTLEA
jgi:hypothetical protein